MFSLTIPCEQCGGSGLVAPPGCRCNNGTRHDASAGCLPVTCPGCNGHCYFDVTITDAS